MGWIVNEGEERMLKSIIAYEPLILKLFVSNTAYNSSAIYTDYTEVSGGGYASIELSTSTAAGYWTISPAYGTGETARAAYAMTTFVFTTVLTGTSKASCTFTSGQTTISLPDTSSIVVGQLVTSTQAGIASPSYVTAIQSSTSITLSAAATATGSNKVVHFANQIYGSMLVGKNSSKLYMVNKHPAWAPTGAGDYYNTTPIIELETKATY